MNGLGNRVAWFVAIVLACGAGAWAPRILVVGDSWTPSMISTLQDSLDAVGMSMYGVVGNTTAIGGTTAAQWSTPYYLNLITQALNANPSVDIVHLSMGGNDILGSVWSTPEEFQALAESVFDDIDTVVAHILGIRPNARIVWCSYDYVQLASLNDELGMAVQEAIERAATNPNYFCIDNLGLMHVYYGYPGQFGPFERPMPGSYPDYTPLMGGDPSLPGPPAAFVDLIHLTYDGYGILADRCVSEFYQDWLTPEPPGTPIGAWPLVVLLPITVAWSSRRALRRAR